MPDSTLCPLCYSKKPNTVVVCNACWEIMVKVFTRSERQRHIQALSEDNSVALEFLVNSGLFPFRNEQYCPLCFASKPHDQLVCTPCYLTIKKNNTALDSTTTQVIDHICRNNTLRIAQYRKTGLFASSSKTICPVCSLPKESQDSICATCYKALSSTMHHHTLASTLQAINNNDTATIYTVQNIVYPLNNTVKPTENKNTACPVCDGIKDIQQVVCSSCFFDLKQQYPNMVKLLDVLSQIVEKKERKIAELRKHKQQFISDEALVDNWFTTALQQLEGNNG